MIRFQRCLRPVGAFVFAAACGFLSGCTLLDEILPGTPFTPDQPVAEITVQGGIYIDSASGNDDGCVSGMTILYGAATNTGDIDLEDLYIKIDALDAGNNVLGSYRVHIFNGDVVELEGKTKDEKISIAGTSLAVGETGTFQACTQLPFGSVRGTAYRVDPDDYIVLDEDNLQ